MNERIEEWKREISKHKKLILLSLVFLAIAIMLNSTAGNYVDKTANIAVSDLILDHFGPINLFFIFSYGYIFMVIILFAYPLFFKIKELHSTISQISLLILVRSFFIILTHLRAPLDAVRGNMPLIYRLFSFSNDMFFSGHTAVAFMGFLLFRKEKIGIFFLILSFVMAFTVLAMHVHYSIDVFAAFFITYGVHNAGKFIFSKLESYKKFS